MAILEMVRVYAPDELTSAVVRFIHAALVDRRYWIVTLLPATLGVTLPNSLTVEP